MKLTDEYGMEFGRALCDRLGLDPARTIRDYELRRVNGKTYCVSLTVFQMLSMEDVREIEHTVAKRLKGRKWQKRRSKMLLESRRRRLENC